MNDTTRVTIQQRLQDLNRVWVMGNPDALVEYFHEDMVIVTLDFMRRISGRQECIQTYKDFLEQASIDIYDESEPVVDVFGNTAVATYTWDIIYLMDDKRFIETGKDVFVFVYQNERWLAAWRTIIQNAPV